MPQSGPSTLAFGLDGAAPIHAVGGHLWDVSGDGLADLLSHYQIQNTILCSFGHTSRTENMHMEKLSISLAIALAVLGSLGCSEAWDTGTLGLVDEWVDSTETDPMTDEVTKSVSYTSFDGLHVRLFCYKPERQFQPTLAIRITPSKQFLSRQGGVHSMMVRIDAGEIHTHDEVLWVGRPASALIHEMSDGEVMRVRTIQNDRSVDYTVNLGGFKAQLDTVLFSCPRFARSESPSAEE